MVKVKLILAAALLVCLFPMPYGYYTLVRFASMVVFAYLAWNNYKRNNESLMITCGALALLFQPFIKIALGKVVWNVVDVAVALTLIWYWWTKERNKNVR